jgi:hypothetical protein
LARFSPRRCSICSHADRESINKAIVAQEPFRNIARRFDTSLSAVYRHGKEHLPKTLVKAVEAREVVHGEDLLGQLLTLRDKTMSILDQAEATGDLRVALYAIKEARVPYKRLQELHLVDFEVLETLAQQVPCPVNRVENRIVHRQ